MILIIGSNGQLGRQMQKVLTARGEAFAAYDYPEIDITQPDSMQRLIDTTRPDAIVNCAAYTNVDKAEVATEAGSARVFLTFDIVLFLVNVSEKIIPCAHF
jgi:dTDP-4-dehydrorhamnose reductase